MRNTSGVTGVYWHAERRRWCAQIRVGGKGIHIGLYDDIDEAARARRKAERDYGLKRKVYGKGVSITGIERFDSKAEQSGECFVWRANCNHAGYGKFWWEGKTISAHRFAYTQVVGPVPNGLQLDHICHVRECVNPKHLRVVTPQENIDNAINHCKQRTRCPRGHKYDHRLPNGKRVCRKCGAAAQRRFRKRKREKRCAG